MTTGSPARAAAASPRSSRLSRKIRSYRDLDKVSGHYQHIIETVRIGRKVIVSLLNPDTGPVDTSIADSPADALRNLADAFDDDL